MTTYSRPVSRRRRIEALRALAERPGTPAEGEVARKMLERAEAHGVDPEESFRSFIRTGSMDDLASAVGPLTCECGTTHPPFTKCSNLSLHQRIRRQMEVLFPRGARVYYNRWAYPPNAPARVTGYGKDWNWIRLKFDHLKSIRSVPAYDNRWHLFTDPIEYGDLRRMNIRGGMENFESRPTPEVTA